jgi:type IV secretion system protein VirB10
MEEAGGREKFEGWAKSVRAGKSSGIKIMLVGVICFFAIGVLLVLMMNFSRGIKTGAKSGGQVSAATQGGQLSSDMSRVFQENEEKIRALQQVTASLASLKKEPNSEDFDHADTAKMRADLAAQSAWIARQNAPTNMYHYGKSGQGLGNQKASAGLDGMTDLIKAESGLLSQSGVPENTSVAEKLAHPRDTVLQGEFIHAVLETAVNSDLPGMVRAEVTEPVYSYRGERILIPAGSRLIGQYASRQENGPATQRVFIIWTRIITPLGVSILIDSPGTDSLGRSGMGADAINHYFFQIFGQAILFSVLGAGVSNVGVSEESQPNSADQFRQSVAESLQDSASKSLKSNTENISPTLHIYQGSSVVVFVSKDLDLSKALSP